MKEILQNFPTTEQPAVRESIRLVIASVLLHGLIVNLRYGSYQPGVLARRAISETDALLEELEDPHK